MSVTGRRLVAEVRIIAAIPKAAAGEGPEQHHRQDERDMRRGELARADRRR